MENENENESSSANVLDIVNEHTKNESSSNFTEPQREVLYPRKLERPPFNKKERGFCCREGCNNEVYRRKKNFESYCSRDCYWEEVNKLEKTQITILDENDLAYIRVARRFNKSLKTSKNIKAILRLQMPFYLVQRHLEYKEKVAKEKRGCELKDVTHRMYHGTKITRKNHVGLENIDEYHAFCTERTCGLCGITFCGNKISYSNFVHLGNLMWFANDPKTSSYYCGYNEPINAMFVVDVVAPDFLPILTVNKDEADEELQDSRIYVYSKLIKAQKQLPTPPPSGPNTPHIVSSCSVQGCNQYTSTGHNNYCAQHSLSHASRQLRTPDHAQYNNNNNNYSNNQKHLSEPIVNVQNSRQPSPNRQNNRQSEPSFPTNLHTQQHFIRNNGSSPPLSYNSPPSSTTSPCIDPSCQKPKYKDIQGRIYNLCAGLVCATSGRSSTSFIPNVQNQNALQNGQRQQIPKCKNPGCNFSCSINSNGHLQDTCGSPNCLPHRIPTILKPHAHTKHPMVLASAILGPIDNGRKCANPSCGKTAFTDPNNPNKFEAFCSNRCFWLEVSTLTKTKLTTLPRNDADYARIVGSFELPSVTIKGILRIQMPKSIAHPHLELRKAMANNINVDPALITHRLYHGTNVKCGPLGIIHGGVFCNNPECGMCGIAREGNKSSKSKHNGYMFFTNRSQTAYQCAGQGKTKAIFVTDVLSIERNFNFVVNTDQATLPRFLILCE
ncbi:6445_t:CDS:2 [Ambispora gerdemannii]|uniref:6445_t:CDS:1 n=1 Tax=Ambispora gerdemannii TaxID=144530 RepID=A0A9N8WBJ6_9GLOM|nr:6445_t:CDS:2 [Ambispora gerdemannii]